MPLAQELASYHTNNAGIFINCLESNLNSFETYSIGALNSMFANLFDIIGVQQNQTFGILFGYMLSVQMYHLLFDCLVFFIHLLHSYTDCERWQR